ncbi:MAG: DUF4249 domain-containing protein [Muribaculaceae bacterium]|nr:DUF4249 domain-containing protein [Muribaculaceae bacterium]
MNSEITPGERITLFLTRTWRWDEGDQYKIDVEVRDAEVRLIVNGKFRELLIPDTVRNKSYPVSPYPEIRECYRGDYVPASGDEIRIEAISAEYGEAWAETKVPYPVPIDRIEIKDASGMADGDPTGFPANSEQCRFDIAFKLAVYFTDPGNEANYYDLKLGSSPIVDTEDSEAYFFNGWPDFSGEPLFTEHVSVLESAMAETSGYTIFSDRQINGKSYPLRINYSSGLFYYRNPLNLQEAKEYGITFRLRHIDTTYYRNVISIWEANDAIIGSLGGVGLANVIFPYSNVSTGAGTVVAYAVSEKTIPLVDIVEATGIVTKSR